MPLTLVMQSVVVLMIVLLMQENRLLGPGGRLLVLAFGGSKRYASRPTHQYQAGMVAASSFACSDSKLPISLTSEMETELWLDLRDIAVLPRTALSRLFSPDNTGARFSVDRVLVEEEDISRDLQFIEEGDPDMLFVRERDGKLCDARDLSRMIGTSFVINSKPFVDPTPAIETASKGGWVFIDFDYDKGYDDKHDDAVSSLVQLLIGASGSGGMEPQLAGGLLLDVGTPVTGDDAEVYANDGRAGIAISCRTKDDIIKAAATVQLVLSGKVESTDSGILLQSNSGKDHTSVDGQSGPLSALVLPFDPSLWETASFVLGDLDEDLY